MRSRPTLPGASRPPRRRRPELPVQRLERVDDADHAADSDPSAVELGVKFTHDVDGFITGFASTRATDNTGTHVGNLWTAGGALLAHGHLQRRDGVGLAAGELRDPVAGHGEHGLCRVVLRTERATTRLTSTTSPRAA